MSHVRKTVGLPTGSRSGKRVPRTVQIFFRSSGNHNGIRIQDISDLEETLATRAPHEEITRQVSRILKEEAEAVLVLSIESCAFCQTCTYPEGNHAAILNVCFLMWKDMALSRQILPNGMGSSFSKEKSSRGSLSCFLAVVFDVCKSARLGLKRICQMKDDSADYLFSIANLSFSKAFFSSRET